MNASEKVARLEALLERVQKNAAIARAERGADVAVRGAHADGNGSAAPEHVLAVAPASPLAAPAPAPAAPPARHAPAAAPPPAARPVPPPPPSSQRLNAPVRPPEPAAARAEQRLPTGRSSAVPAQPPAQPQKLVALAPPLPPPAPARVSEPGRPPVPPAAGSQPGQSKQRPVAPEPLRGPGIAVPPAAAHARPGAKTLMGVGMSIEDVLGDVLGAAAVKPGAGSQPGAAEPPAAPPARASEPMPAHAAAAPPFGPMDHDASADAPTERPPANPSAPAGPAVHVPPMNPLTQTIRMDGVQDARAALAADASRQAAAQSGFPLQPAVPGPIPKLAPLLEEDEELSNPAVPGHIRPAAGQPPPAFAQAPHAQPAPMQPPPQAHVPVGPPAMAEMDMARPARGPRTGTVVGIVLFVFLALAAGAYFALRKGMINFSRFTSGPQTTAAAAPTPAPPPPAAVDTSTAAPSETAAPQPTAAATGSAAASPSSAAAASPSAAASDAAQLPADQGFLIVTSTTPADVYINGVRVGAAGTRLSTQCGAKFIRLAKPDTKTDTPAWSSSGHTVHITCRGVTTVTLPP